MPRSTSTPSSSSSASTYHHKSSVRKSQENTPMEESKARELEEFSQLYFKYTKLFDDQAAAMRHDPIRLKAAHEVVSAETAAEQVGLLPSSARSSEQIQADLRELARRCEIAPRSFEDRIRISFAAHAYVRTMMDCVVGSPDRPYTDFLTVIGRGSQLVREDILHQASQNNSATLHSPPPTITPAIVKLTPDSKITRLVEDQDIADWQSNPDRLVGKGFISGEMVHRIFIVADYAVKQVKGAQYDVIYEDSGLDDVQVVDPDTLLEMVAEAELITNM